MEIIDIARKLAELNQVSDAQKAYFLVIQQSNKDIERYEAALYFLYTGNNQEIAYSILLELHKKGIFAEEIIKNMMNFALVPVINEMEKRYSKNVALLKKYKFIFKNNFMSFEDLNHRFFRIDENGYIPYNLTNKEFGEYQPLYRHKIEHYFFKDLTNPIKAENIYSQYELEYLYDNVRKSEWVAKDNHVYLYYSSFNEFQEYLQVIDFSEILKDQKFVFLFDEERDMYPIDFKKTFGIDYSRKKVKPLNIREIKKLIWGVQYSSHNGGDFFNEIIDSHPNIISTESVMMEEYLHAFEDNKTKNNLKEKMKFSDKDIFLLSILKENKYCFANLDENSRIVPALYIQPHFGNIEYQLKCTNGLLTACSNEISNFDKYNFIKEFKYVKTFVPIRRFTTSMAAENRFQMNDEFQSIDSIPSDSLAMRLMNKALFVNSKDRMFVDSCVVRFEDGKLNPKATFTALAGFLDVPYTKSMMYCTGRGKINPESLKGNALGFDVSTVYKTYNEFCDDEERAILEFFYQDMMKKYGYSNKYLENENISLDELKNLANSRKSLYKMLLESRKKYELTKSQNPELALKNAKNYADRIYENYQNGVITIIEILYEKYPLINEEGIRLELMELLKLDESLLEQPLYR